MKATCNFKTLKSDTGSVIREHRPAVAVEFPKIDTAEALNHARFLAYVETKLAEDAKAIIQGKERVAAMVSGNTKYIHDMQADANEVTLDAIFSDALDRAARNGGMSKEDIEGWWKATGAEHTRAYYKNSKGYDDVRVSQACAFLYSKFLALHSGRFIPDDKLKEAMTVSLNRLEAHVVRDYLLEKLAGKKLEEFDADSLI